MATISTLGIVQIPDRLEPLRAIVGAERLSQVLIRPTRDIDEIKKATIEVRGSGQGKLLFLLGSGGIGKSCLANAVPMFLTDIVQPAPVIVPSDNDLELPELVNWLQTHTPPNRKQITIFVVDARENPAYKAVIAKGAMLNLNAFLRTTPNILLLWPVTSRDFAERLCTHLTEAGGTSALIKKKIYPVAGLEPSEWFNALNLLLKTTSVSLADAAVGQEEAEALVSNFDRIGDFLAGIRELIESKYDLGEIGASLPKLTIAVSSLRDLRTMCRLLQRTQGYLADPDRVLRNCRANVKDDWDRSARANPKHGFHFIASVLNLRITHVSASAVVNACAQSADPELAALAKTHYPQAQSANVANSMRSTSLARALAGEEDTGTGYATPSKPIHAAYTAIQAHSQDSRWHRAINEAIVAALQQPRVGIQLPDLEFEFRPLVAQAPERELRADAWFTSGDRPEAIEFTHILDASEAKIAGYVLTKALAYARDYGLLT